jgi:hypothetical protein
VAAVWLGTGVAWAVVVAAEVTLLTERVAWIVAATTLAAAVFGTRATRRIRARGTDTFITVKDLRRR